MTDAKEAQASSLNKDDLEVSAVNSAALNEQASVESAPQVKEELSAAQAVSQAAERVVPDQAKAVAEEDVVEEQAPVESSFSLGSMASAVVNAVTSVVSSAVTAFSDDESKDGSKDNKESAKAKEAVKDKDSADESASTVGSDGAVDAAQDNVSANEVASVADNASAQESDVSASKADVSSDAAQESAAEQGSEGADKAVAGDKAAVEPQEGAASAAPAEAAKAVVKPANAFLPERECKVTMVVAMGLDRAIGERGTMPWYLPDDLKHFKAQTINSCVIMGRRTFESIGRPLPSRRNIVITSSQSLAERSDIEVAPSLEAALELAKDYHHAKDIMHELEAKSDNVNVIKYDKIVIIGGAGLFEAGLEIADSLIITEIRARFPHADTFFPDFKQVGCYRLVSIAPRVTDYRAFYYCEAKQPLGFAQEVADLDQEDLLVNAENAMLDLSKIGEGLSYRHLTYERIVSEQQNKL